VLELSSLMNIVLQLPFDPRNKRMPLLPVIRVVGNMDGFFLFIFL